MYQTRPDDYTAFRCLAGACPQTCCAAWEIVVDPDAQDAYLRLQHPLAAKLRRVLRVDSEGDTYFAQTDGRCRFCVPTACVSCSARSVSRACAARAGISRAGRCCCATGWSRGYHPRARRPRGRLLERSAPLRFVSAPLPDDGYVPGVRERRLTAAVTAVRDRVLALLARPGHTAYENLAAARAFACAAQRLLGRHRIAALAGRGCAGGDGRCSAGAHAAGGAGGGVRVPGAARCPLAGAAAARGGAPCLPAAQNDARAADMPRADDRLAARHGRARRP